MSVHLIEICNALVLAVGPDAVSQLGLQDVKHLVFGDLRWLPEPDDMKSDIPLILINPTQSQSQLVDNQRRATRTVTQWDVVLVHKFDIARPFKTHVERTDLLHTLLLTAAPKLSYAKLHDENQQQIGHIETVDVSAPVCSPPENELFRHDARFWNSIVVSTIQVTTSSVAMNVPDPRKP